MHYRSLELGKVEVASIADEVKLRIFSWVKGAATVQGVLEKTCMEKLMGLGDQEGGENLAAVLPEVLLKVSMRVAMLMVMAMPWP